MADTAGKRYLGSSGRNEDSVARFEPNVFRPVAMQHQVVKVELHRGLGIPSHLNFAQRTLNARAAGGKERVQNRAERANGIGPRAASLSNHIDLDGAKVAQIDR